jgi:hypothetical protein
MAMMGQKLLFLGDIISPALLLFWKINNGKINKRMTWALGPAYIKTSNGEL